VEGPILTSHDDVNHHALKIIEDVARRNAQSIEAPILKHFVAPLIAPRPITH
jgi:hypothetical protein